MWADRRFANIEHLYLRPPKDVLMRVPDRVLKTAVFLGRDTSTGREYGGTGYCVEIAFEGPEPTKIILLGTAAHVAEELEGHDFYIRANKKDGSLAEIQVDCTERWWYHPTEREAVDAAVMILPVGSTYELDILEISQIDFVSDGLSVARGLGVGDEVFVVGLFKKAKGRTKNIPIIRTGNVAMMPEEKIPFPVKDKPNQEIYADLLECRSTGGLSGSPVFIRETIQTRSGPSAEQLATGNFYFYGSMIGHWEVEVPVSDTQRELLNMGIAPMVPIQKIYEVIMQKELLSAMGKIHDKVLEEREKRDGSAMLDSGFADKEPTQTTSEGFDIPVPGKDQFETALKKASRKIETNKSS